MFNQNFITPNNQKIQYKYPYIFLGLYLTFLLLTVCLAGKLVVLGNLLLPGGIFVFVFTFAICDIVGEVYGYAYPRLFIWVGVIAEFIFALLATLISHFSSPEIFTNANAYPIVFDPTIRYVFSGLIGLIIGEFTNVYLLAKWKIYLKGKLFIIRSLISTGLGQAFLTIIVDVLNYSGKVSSLDLIKMMMSGYIWKMFFAIILIFPSWLLVKRLKNAEKVDYFDVNTNFNPFILSLDNKYNDRPNLKGKNFEKLSY